MRCCLYQALAAFTSPLKVATAASRVTVTLAPALNGKRALAGELELVVLGRVVAADHADLEVRAGRAVGGADAHALALEEAVGEAARAVGADEAAVDGVEGRGARPQALEDELADDRAAERAARAGRLGERDRRRGDREDVPVPVGRAEAGDPDQLPGREAVADEGADDRCA